MATDIEIHSDLAIPPGEYLAEVLDECGLSQAELARRMGRPPQMINEIVKGEKMITPETALQLGQVVRVPAHIWTGLETEYQLVKAKLEEAAAITKEAELVGRFPYSTLARFGAVSRTNDREQRVRELRRFLGVASLHNLSLVQAYEPAFRQAAYARSSPEAVASWLRLGALRAQEIKTESYDATGLRAALPELRRLTRKPPTVFPPSLKNLLANHGVAFILLPHLPRTYVYGATFWLPVAKKAVLMMTIRGKWADIFWFSLLHELGHIIQHGKRYTFVEDSDGDPERQELEDEANQFARDTLIAPHDYEDFVSQGRFTRVSIRDFANRIEIAPGIVTGRLQHDGHLPHNRHLLRERYEWADQ